SASMKGDYAVIEVGAGSYHFTSELLPRSSPRGSTHALSDNRAVRVAVLLSSLGLVALAGTLLFTRRRRSAGV
ncbi:MAG TPA: hypothetical protein VLL25_16545, partial [Acidimicrobiales bacterium]|nr:hypothetical protein [Acidimicrobiales bacterium]